MFEIYEREIKLALALVGAGSVDELDGSFVSVPPAWLPADVSPRVP